MSGILGRQKDVLVQDIASKQYNVDFVLPVQLDLVKEQREAERAKTLDTRTDSTPVDGSIGTQKDLITEQIDLVKEQREAERAKTMDTRTDGSTIVTGSIGKQKDLYTQQIDSFVKDSKHKAAKLWFDGWITQKTLDEGIPAPTQLNDTNVNAVLSSLRTENNLT